MSKDKRVKVKPESGAAGRSLDAYWRKRDPARTPEPFGGDRDAGPISDGVHAFVVQQHSARRMHWDFRLEIDGVLASWAVPRGPSVDPKQKRLAVQTEDHPLEYADFEGLIPAGNYGAGAVIVWDCGTYRVSDGVSPAEALRQGKIELDLHGHKLRGKWILVRTKGGSAKDWLLIRKTGQEPVSPSELVQTQPGSVLSGLTVEELSRGVSRTDDLTARAAAEGAPQRALDAASLSPMLADTSERAFSKPGWLFELKYDGVRALAARDSSSRVRLFSRNRRNVTATFPEIARAVGHIPCEQFVLDGEIVALDDGGISSFERLQKRLALANPATIARVAVEVPVVMYCFDLLAVGAYDLRALPLATRKQLLRRLLPDPGVLRFSDHIEGAGDELFRAAGEIGLEGIIAKRAASRYECGRRSRDWLKIKTVRTADLAVIGYLPGKGSRRQLGSLMLAWREEDGLRYAGNVGSGLDVRAVESLRQRLDAVRRSTAGCSGVPSTVARTAVFVEPELVAEVRYGEVTSSGVLRHPVFLRLRDDKSVADCNARPAVRRPIAPAKAPADNRKQKAKVAAPELQLTNLDKVFWPQDGYTKGDLLKYYEQAWPALQPYLRDRPVVLTRYPDGIEGKSFYQKNAPDFTPDWVQTHRVEDTDYFVCNDLETLLYIINLGCIPVHVWSARRGSLDHPDWAILDLDPKGAPFRDVVAIAKEIHALLSPLDVPHFVKTSGQDGLHVLVPLDGTLTHAEARTFAEVLARIVAAAKPDIATVARPLGDRGGKVYVDFLQNGFGKTIAAPFSVRPRAGAPVSTPLEWREVNARMNPAKFTIRTIPARLRRLDDPMRAVLSTHADIEAVLSAMAARVG